MRRFRARSRPAGSGPFRLGVKLSPPASCADGDRAIPDFGQSLLNQLAIDTADVRTALATDGSFEFSLASVPTSTDDTQRLYGAVQDGSGTWVAALNFDGFLADTLLRSTDGDAWTDQAAPFDVAILDYAGQFIVLGDNFEDVATSPTGEVWTPETGLALAGSPSFVAFGNGRTVVVGHDGAASPLGMWSDGDGTWTEITFPALGRDVFGVTSLVYDDTYRSWRLYLDDDSATFNGVLTSADGDTWADATDSLDIPRFNGGIKRGATGWYYGIVFGGGDPVEIVTSRDGLAFSVAFEAVTTTAAVSDLQTNNSGRWLLAYGTASHSRVLVWKDGARGLSEVDVNIDDALGGGNTVRIITAPVPLPSADACSHVASPLRIRVA